MDEPKKREQWVMELEYKSAQEMLRHYDLLNWQIGSILIAATVVMTGLALNKEFLTLLRQPDGGYLPLAFVVPGISLFVLDCWYRWFTRHRVLYNLRNETLHRVEQEVGMYHFLRVAEHAGGLEGKDEQLKAAARAVVPFEALYFVEPLPKPSGFVLARRLAYGIPTLQLLIFLALWFSRPPLPQ